MKTPRLKRIKVDKYGIHWPQYKLLFWWRTYRNLKNKKECFGDMWGVKQFLRGKHNQDLAAIEQHAKRGVINWNPEQ